MRDWQPIETAPKEGVVLVAMSSEGEQWVEAYSAKVLDAPGVKKVATHWMPFPDPPHPQREG